MAYSPHTLVAFGGTLNTTSTPGEVWQCTVRGIQPAGDTAPNQPLSDLDGYLADIHAALSSAWTGSGMIGSVTTLAWVKANNIGANGKYLEQITHMYDYVPDVAGTGNPNVPMLLSLRSTFTTALKRGPGHSGGFYLPNMGLSMVGSGKVQVAAASITAMNTLAGNILTALQNKGAAYGTGKHFAPVIASKVSGALTPITGIKHGDVIDVQRRRKNAINETYTAGAWTP